MAQFVNMRKVDLANGEPAVFSLRQLYYADENANRIGAIVLMNGEPFPLSGTCTGTAIRADGATVPMTGTVEDNQAYITLIPDCYAVEGDIQIFVKLTTGDVTATLVAARGTVRLTETGAVIDPGEIIPSVSALITSINDAIASIPADYSDLLAAIAPDYTDLTFPVSAGTWCWYDGDLYRAVVDIPATETWTAAHWETAPLSNALAGDIADIKSASELYSFQLRRASVIEKAYVQWESGTLNYSTGADAADTADRQIRSGFLLAAPGEEIQFTGVSADRLAIVCSYDKNKDFIAGSRQSIISGQAYTISANTYYVRFIYGFTAGAGQTVTGYGGVNAVAADWDISCISPIESDIDDRVSYAAAQTLTDAKKAIARSNIGAAEAGDVADLESAFDEITDTKQSKNLYNPAACNPTDKYTYNSSGAYTASDVFATSGKIPVDPETQYIFSAGGARVKNVRYFKGDSGETFISGENVDDGPFTTPALCTFVAVQLFSATHTIEQYEAAIAVAQLEKGAIATPYEPYGETHYVPLSAVEDGEQLSGLSNLVAEQSKINLYDKSLAVNGKYYYADGSVQTSADWAITGFIPVEPNTQYNISRDPDTPMVLGGTVKMYDANQSYVGNASLGNYVYNSLYAFVTGPTTRYIGVGLRLTSHTEQDFTNTINTVMLCYGTQRPLNYSAYDAETVIPADRISNAYQANPDCFTGKKWLATGTSITWYDGKIYADGEDAGDLCRGYVGNVTRRKKLLVTNEGISGSTLGDVSQYSLINRYTSLDWANSDIATIEYGVNDLGNSVPVGTAADAAGTTTFAACLKTVIEYALTQNPRLCLVICTEPDVRGNNTNSNGNTLKDYSDVTLEIAAQYRLPVCDWYYHGGFNTLTKGTNKLTIEGTHPNNAGHMRMGAMLNQVFDSLMC